MPNTPVLGLPYPTPSDTADVPRDIRALAEALDNSPALIPVGGIVLWSVTAIPANWLLCNGAPVPVEYPKLLSMMAFTPDLRGRVPVGHDAAQGEFDALNESGGAKTVALTEAQLPAHKHTPGTLAVQSHSHGGGTGWIANNIQGTGGTIDHLHRPEIAGYNFLVHLSVGADPFAATVSRSLSGSQGVAVMAARLADDIGVLGHTSPTDRDLNHYHAMNPEAPGLTGESQATGSSATHQNLPPYLTMNWIIRAD